MSQSAYGHHQSYPRLSPRARRCRAAGFAVLACRVLATPPEVLSPRMVRVIEGLAEEWRGLDDAHRRCPWPRGCSHPGQLILGATYWPCRYRFWL